MAAVEAWESVKQAIEAYTGMSPATFFTVLAVAVAFYYAVAGFFQPPPRTLSAREFEEAEPLPAPVQLGEITEEDLRSYDGSDPQKPLLMAIKGQIYDVTQSRMFYGPGGPYALFAGKDASRALAKMSFEPTDLTSDISGLGPFELDALQDWEYKFMSKYIKVGTIKKVESVTVEPDVSTSDATEETSQITETPGSPLEHTAQAKDSEAEIDTDSEHCAKSKEEGETGKEFEAKENDHSADVKDAHNA